MLVLMTTSRFNCFLVPFTISLLLSSNPLLVTVAGNQTNDVFTLLPSPLPLERDRGIGEGRTRKRIDNRINQQLITTYTPMLTAANEWILNY
uniref:Secreted protein n=1 Tax=Setaria viridis TaxID=4556 RepID=A0A4U6TDQ1_SETVI|nr:hypothetical protein SEVIR_8G004301v2 [Setaria viridis]